tara:strand:- start:2719 stop:3030 length:312 start_codon:yes stop_codon:yes gene_type:complete
MVVWKSLSKRRSLKLTRSRRYKSRRPKSRNVRLGRGKSRRRGRKRPTRRHRRRQRGGTYSQFQSNLPRSLGYSLGGYLDPAVPGAIAQATHTPAHTYKKCGNL